MKRLTDYPELRISVVSVYLPKGKRPKDMKKKKDKSRNKHVMDN